MAPKQPNRAARRAAASAASPSAGRAQWLQDLKVTDAQLQRLEDLGPVAHFLGGLKGIVIAPGPTLPGVHVWQHYPDPNDQGSCILMAGTHPDFVRREFTTRRQRLWLLCRVFSGRGCQCFMV